MAGFLPSTTGVLDDQLECWFITAPEPGMAAIPGLETTFQMGQSQQWLTPPQRPADWEG